MCYHEAINNILSGVGLTPDGFSSPKNNKNRKEKEQIPHSQL